MSELRCPATARIAGEVQLDLSSCPNVLAFQARVASRPAARAAMVAEGLIG